MIALLIIPLILAFSPAAVWAFRTGGLRRLWLLCGCAFLTILLLALLLSDVYAVPSTWRVILYFLTSIGPSILFATGSLSLIGSSTRTASTQLITALTGSTIGLVVGFALAIYGFGGW